MKLETISQDIETLPPEAQQTILDFIKAALSTLAAF